MTRPLLLIVDGESLRTPGLVSAMEGDGWLVQWAKSGEVDAFLAQGQTPDLLLLDGPSQGTEGVRKLRSRIAGLPVLVMLDHPGVDAPVEEGIQGVLERTLPHGEITAALRRFMPGEAKAPLTTHDIFGDLVAEIEQEGTNSGTDPFAILDRAPGVEAKPALPIAPVEPIHVPRPNTEPPKRPMTSEDIFGDVLEEIEGMGKGAALPSTPKPPLVARIPAPKAEAAPVPEAKPLTQGEFTLTGISGVHDPFDWSKAEGTPSSDAAAKGPVTPPAAGRPEAAAQVPISQALEEYGNYYLLEKIAVGGMAELFKAQQRGVQGFQKIVAIKRILPHLSDNEDFVTMFIDEAKLAAQLTHPNIVQIFDLGKAGNSYYIAMEYVNGRDLRTLLRKAREFGLPFPEAVAGFVLMKVAAALDYAHRKKGFDDRELKLVHRDISPQNVLISQEGAVKLVDFGIAKAVSKASHTVAGALKGKLLYMSPEQAMGQALDNRSDLYSLGLVLFEMLTGERCFQADSELGVLEKVRLGRVQDVTLLNPQVSREMAAIVTKSLQKNVDHRYPSARFMERDLRELLMKQGHIPTEHDVAEYIHALLTGTKEDVERVMHSRFPAPTLQLTPRLNSGSHPSLQETQAALPTGSGATVGNGAEQAPLPERPERLEPPAVKPIWLLPVILALLGLLILLIWVAGRT
ncbi:MAG TPA: protein kinase [Holophagaceae bacterium]|nr:protein kinase [Holophagaceae bacterium]